MAYLSWVTKFLKNIWRWSLKHKIAASLIALLIIGGGYWSYQKVFGATTVTKYVLGQVEKGNIVATVSGTGQVSGSNQIDVTSKVSGEVTQVRVTSGQEIAAGTVLVTLDSTDALKNVRDAQISLESTKLAIAKAEAAGQSTDDLRKNYLSALATLPKLYTDIYPIYSELEDILFNNNVSNSNETNIQYYVDIVNNYSSKTDPLTYTTKSDLATLRDLYNQTFADYKKIDKNSSGQDIEDVITESYNLTKQTNDLIKTTLDTVTAVKDKLLQDNTSLRNGATINSQFTTLTAEANTTNDYLQTLASLESTIKSLHQSDTNSAFDLESQALTLRQRENALADAQETLAEYYVRAPFDGVVGKISVNKYDNAGNGTSLVTLITKKKVAQISLNEVDISKIKVGQKATLTFDALPDLSITGEVSQADLVGTVSQGVVTYSVKITFDTDDDRVKSGMSVSANIITNSKTDVLLVPISAVKTSGGESYVERFNPALNEASSTAAQGVESNQTPIRQTVVTGLSNDTSTEIISGLIEGEQIIVRTTTAASTKTTQSTPSIFGTGSRTSGASAARAFRN